MASRRSPFCSRRPRPRSASWRIGFVDGRILLAALAMTPVLVAGAWLGVRANRRLPRRAFELILVAIAIAGSLRLLLSR